MSGPIKRKKRKKKYWYKFYHGECPVCGNPAASYKVRVYTPKPEDPQDRHEQLSYAETYDQCLEREALAW